MTVAVATPFNMDEQAFLQTMDRLIERFDRYSSGRCFADLDRIRLEHDMEGPLSLFDDVVHELADDLFGGTSWPVNLDMDMIILDRFQIGYDAEFLTGCRNVVRKYGMSAWLYEMINDASVAVATHRPSNRMPFQLGLFDTREVFRRKKTKGKKSGGGRRKRLECMMEYLRQTYRLAAYTLLRWGGGEPRAADAALMVLAYGGLGMCMLRDDPKVVELGCDPDFRYRHVCAQLQDMRIKADLEYACSVDLSVTSSLEYPACSMPDICMTPNTLWRHIGICGMRTLSPSPNYWPRSRTMAYMKWRIYGKTRSICMTLPSPLWGRRLRVFSRKASDCVIEPCSRMVSKNLTARHAM